MLTSESAKPRYGVVERNINFNSLADKVFNILEFMKLVFVCHIFPVNGDHASHEAAKRCNTIAFLQGAASIERRLSERGKTYPDA